MEGVAVDATMESALDTVWIRQIVRKAIINAAEESTPAYLQIIQAACFVHGMSVEEVAHRLT